MTKQASVSPHPQRQTALPCDWLRGRWRGWPPQVAARGDRGRRGDEKCPYVLAHYITASQSASERFSLPPRRGEGMRFGASHLGCRREHKRGQGRRRPASKERPTAAAQRRGRPGLKGEGGWGPGHPSCGPAQWIIGLHIVRQSRTGPCPGPRPRGAALQAEPRALQ